MSKPILPVMADLLAEIDACLAATGMNESEFGRGCMNDHKLIPDIRAGRELRWSNQALVRKHIAECLAKVAA